MSDPGPGVEGWEEDVDFAVEQARRTMVAKTLADVLELAAYGVRSPTCPSCGAAPEPHLTSITWPAQAWCATDECAVLIWNPRASARENLDGGQEVRLEDPDPPATRPRRDDDFGQAVGDL